LNYAVRVTKIINDVTGENDNSYRVLQLALNTLYVIANVEMDLDFVMSILKFRLLSIIGFKPDLREYWIGAQILRDLGCRSLRLLTNNPEKVYGLAGFGLKVLKRVPIEIQSQEYDRFYLKTKKDKMGHIFTEDFK